MPLYSILFICCLVGLLLSPLQFFYCHLKLSWFFFSSSLAAHFSSHCVSLPGHYHLASTLNPHGNKGIVSQRFFGRCLRIVSSLVRYPVRGMICPFYRASQIQRQYRSKWNAGFNVCLYCLYVLVRVCVCAIAVPFTVSVALFTGRVNTGRMNGYFMKIVMKYMNRYNFS